MGALSRAFRRTLLRLESSGPPTDGQLLERFAQQRDQAAFEELVRRHGPMVLRVCARVLRQAQDAEDAFQATWIVLARKAGAIGRPDRLAGWLHGVAHRVALQAKQRASQARAHEKAGEEAGFPDLSQGDSGGAVVLAESRAVLDEELNRLPQKYHLPVVLHYLEGKTTDEVARQLNWPKGTVTVRLSRARDLLRDRLARRGLALGEAAVAALLAQETATAAVQAAQWVAAGHSLSAAALSERVGSLAEATLRAMAPNKAKIAAAIVVGICVLGAGASVLLLRSEGSEAPKTKEVDSADPSPATKPRPKTR